MCNKAYCCNLQPSASLEHTSICIPFPDLWLVQALPHTGQNQEEKMGMIKKGKPRGIVATLQDQVLPPLRSVLFITHKRSVCLSCN